MAIRRHAVELGLSFPSDGMVLIHPKDLDDLDDPQNPWAELSTRCHIYLILKRPRLTYVPGSLDVDDQHLSVRVRYLRAGMPAEATLRLRGKPNEGVEARLEEQVRPRLVINNNGEELVIPAHTLSFICDEITDATVREAEVVYVGMSYADGTRSAKDRLRSHSTLQQVLADLNGDEPDDEALVLMVEFQQPFFIMSIDGRTRPTPDASRNVGADFGRTERELTLDLRIALIEAGLIRYFQPRYNEKYKQRFPHPTQRILQEVYAIDFGALTVELNTEAVNLRTYSPVRPAGFYHMASVDLHDPSVRHSFFNIMNVENGPDASTTTGPMY